MKTTYDGTSNFGGIYRIYNQLNGRSYYGSTSIFKRRYYQHKSALKNKKHSNSFLQADFNKCGTDAFIFEVLDICLDPLERLKKEQEYLNQFYNSEKCYNLTNEVSPILYHRTIKTETKKKQSEIAKQRWIINREKLIKQKQDPEYRKNLSDSKSKTYQLRNPNNKIIIIFNMEKYCKEYRLNRTDMQELYHGKRNYYRGWTRVEDDPIIKKQEFLTNREKANASKCKKYKMISPTGEIVEIYNMKKFCRENSLTSANMFAVIKNKLNSHKGWKKFMQESSQVSSNHFRCPAGHPDLHRYHKNMP